MDVDNDIDQSLLQQFSCMGTTDRDVLITQLQKLVGNQLTAAGCAFFLDMNNWNLQAAICSYYDLESPKDHLPTMAFVRDVTIGEGESVPPSTKFVKTWRLQNSSEEPWPPGCCLKFTEGDCLSTQDRIVVEPLKPLEVADVSVEMISPGKAGIYQGQWRMYTATGSAFGEVIWVIITVAEGGILGLTQQMSQFNELGSPPRSECNQQIVNPFGPNNQKFVGMEQRTGTTVFATTCNPPSLPPSPFISTSAVTGPPSSPVRTNLYQENDPPCTATSEDMCQ